MSNRTTPDRRQAPRREEERLLHYATEGLVAAALNYCGDEHPMVLRDALDQAAERFRAARDALTFQSPPSPQSPPEQSPPRSKSETLSHYGGMLSGESDA